MGSRYHRELERINLLISDPNKFSQLQDSTKKYVLESRKQLRIKLGFDSIKLDEYTTLGFNDKPSYPIYHPPKQIGLSPEYSERNGYGSSSYKTLSVN